MPTQKELIIQELAEGAKSFRDLIAALSAKLQVKRSSLRGRLSELVAAGQVVFASVDGVKIYSLVGDGTKNEPNGYQERVRRLEEKLAGLRERVKQLDSSGDILSDDEIDEYIQYGIKQQPLEQKATGIEKSPRIPIHETGWFGLVCGSDWHIGSIWTQLETLRREAEIIHNTDHLYYVFLGDAGDGGIPAAPHGGILNEQVMPPDMQRAVSRSISRRIGKKMLLAVSGCHDWWTMDAADYDFIKYAAKQIAGCPYLGGSGKFYFECDGGVRWCGYVSHKPRGHSIYNDLHPCVVIAQRGEQEAEIILIAHEHIVAVAKQVVGHVMRYMARTSSRKTFDRYASKLGTQGKLVRVNSGNDSNNHKHYVIESTAGYTDRFFNTAIPDFDFPAPVVFTCNGLYTDLAFYASLDVSNLMAVRVRTNSWNLDVVDGAVEWYTEKEVPVVLTFMRYSSVDSVSNPDDYEWSKHVVNEHWDIRPEVRDEVLDRYRGNLWVFMCGYRNSNLCRDCRVCTILYRLFRLTNSTEI